MRKIKKVLKHMFSKKAIGYRAIALIWVGSSTWLGFRYDLGAIITTIIVVFGKMFVYGIFEYATSKEVDKKI